MTDRPIIFSAPMVRALLEGRKTQTRRALKPQPVERPGLNCRNLSWFTKDGKPRGGNSPEGPMPWIFTPYAPDDRLWVREAWARWLAPEIFGGPPQWITEYRAGKRVLRPRYKGDYDVDNWTAEIADGRKPESVAWRSPIHMPRRLSRLTLIVTDVRVQRVQEISEEDARAEGCGMDWIAEQRRAGTWRGGFRDLWDTLNAKRGFGWSENPWVVALTFAVHRENIDRMPQDAAA